MKSNLLKKIVGMVICLNVNSYFSQDNTLTHFSVVENINFFSCPFNPFECINLNGEEDPLFWYKNKDSKERINIPQQISYKADTVAVYISLTDTLFKDTCLAKFNLVNHYNEFIVMEFKQKELTKNLGIGCDRSNLYYYLKRKGRLMLLYFGNPEDESNLILSWVM